MKLVEIMKQRTYYSAPEVRISFVKSKEAKNTKRYTYIHLTDEICQQIGLLAKEKVRCYMDAENKDFLFIKKSEDGKGFTCYKQGTNSKSIVVNITRDDFFEKKLPGTTKVKHEILEGGIKIYISQFKEKDKCQSLI